VVVRLVAFTLAASPSAPAITVPASRVGRVTTRSGTTPRARSERSM
jgi:hypothetical protein